jgi:hypothetical protein
LQKIYGFFKFAVIFALSIHDLFMVDVIQKSREIRLNEALATFPLKGKVLIPNQFRQSGKGNYNKAKKNEKQKNFNTGTN